MDSEILRNRVEFLSGAITIVGAVGAAIVYGLRAAHAVFALVPSKKIA